MNFEDFIQFLIDHSDIPTEYIQRFVEESVRFANLKKVENV